MTYYRGGAYKFEETARREAIATLIIHRADLASYRWEVLRNSLGERAILPAAEHHLDIASTVRGSEKTFCDGRVGSGQAV